MTSSATKVRIAAIGSYVPQRRESNVDQLAAFELGPEFLYSKIGVSTRAVKEPEETVSDLCMKAFSDLTAQMTITRSDIQLCCVVTQNPDFNIPHTAAVLHQRLELSRSCMTFDVSQGCAGFTVGVTLVISVMERLGLDHALLFTCDPYSKIVDRHDKNTAFIFGDAATVSYLCRSGAGYALIDASFGTAPGTAACLTSSGVLKMDGMEVLMNATREVPVSIRNLLANADMTVEDVDLFLLHPGSRRVVELLTRALGVEPARIPFEIAEYGNTVSSSIPLMLKRQVSQRRCRRLLLSGFGVGFSWGTCLVELYHH